MSYLVPFFIMHYCVFVLLHPDMDRTGLDATVGALLEGFDEADEVEPYRVHFNHEEVRRMAKHFRLKPANLHALAEEMPAWMGREGGVDRDGLYYLTTCNPDGYFDWYEIGGRWDGYIPESCNNVILAGTLAASPALGRCLPFYVLTPEGQWLEKERWYFAGEPADIKTEKLAKKEWLQIVRGTLEQWPDHHVVCVDIHS